MEIAERAGENQGLHEKYVNPSFARVLQIIGYDKFYTASLAACGRWGRIWSRERWPRVTGNRQLLRQVLA